MCVMLALKHFTIHTLYTHTHTMVAQLCSSPQALAVWKMARRDRALSNKITKLAGQPCSYEPVSIEFTVDNLNGRETNTARERTLGLNNRILAGLFLHTWRATNERCPASR